MSGLVKDVLERPSSSSSTSGVPVAPKPPSLSQSNGFPSVTHRSLKPPSAFVRARQERERQAQLKASGKLPQDGKVPIIQTSGDEEPDAQVKPVEMDERQNVERVVAMSLEEREQEKQELLERFGGGLMNTMQKRQQARESKAPSHKASQSTGAEDLRKGKEVESDEKQNVAKVASMTEAEREQEKSELLGRFGGNLTDIMHRRRAAREGRNGNDSKATSSNQAENAPNAESSRRVRFTEASERQVVPQIDPSAPLPEDEDPYSPAHIHRTYFPTTAHDPSKLEWMQAPSASTSEDPTVRFDLSGQALDQTQAARLPAHLGLHHHGSSPELAGYTLQDIYHLCLSTVPSQRVTMFDVLAKIVGRYMLGSLSDDAKEACREGEVTAKAIELSCGVLAGLEKNFNVIRVAVGLLFGAVGGARWSRDGWLDRIAASQHPSFVLQAPGEAENLLVKVPFEALITRFSGLLALNQPDISALTTHQLLRSLRRAAIHSQAIADTICPLVPVAVSTHLMGATNPQLDALPSLETLLLLRDITTSSRACAEALSAQNVYEPLIRFVASLTNEALADVENERLRRSLCIGVLETFTALGRYGLLASITVTGAEIWRDLGAHVSRSLDNPSEDSQQVATAYFDACAVWIVCAIDPHRIVPAHDVTWAQVNAMGWADEALDAFEASVASGKLSTTCCSALRMVSAWLRGSKVNEPLAGGAQKDSVKARIQPLQLETAVSSALSSGDTQLAIALLELFDALGSVQMSTNVMRALEAALPPLLHVTRAGEVETEHSRDQTHLALAIVKALRNAEAEGSSSWCGWAAQLMRKFTPGDEPLALDLLDELLNQHWADVESIKSIGYKDGFTLLRPLLQHTILPDVSILVGPNTPHPIYLKSTSTLRAPATLQRIIPPAEQSTGPPAPVVGLPLPSDWLFSPLNELLQSGTSQSLSQVPPGWDASEVEITRATLVFAKLVGILDTGEDRSFVLLNLMKVYMLEHGQQNSPNPHASEVFRDPAVSAALAALMQPLLYRGGADANVNPSSTTLEQVALPFLGAGVPYFQFFVDFVALFEAISLSDVGFTQLVLPPMSQRYPVDYRKHVWCDQPTSLRSIRLAIEDIPVESSINDYFFPPEKEADILAGYTRALINRWVSKATHPFMFRLAVHHLAGYLWSPDSELAVRDSLLKAVFKSASNAVLQDLLQDEGAGSSACNVDSTAPLEVQQHRRSMVDEVTAGAASQRLSN